jgi:hypothetical protein
LDGRSYLRYIVTDGRTLLEWAVKKYFKVLWWQSIQHLINKYEDKGKKEHSIFGLDSTKHL